MMPYAVTFDGGFLIFSWYSTLDTNTLATHRDFTVSVNNPPAAYIDSISPSPATQGQTVYFYGTGTDSDGAVVAYNWRSSIDGQLSTQEDFSTSSLSVGTHTIYFKVMDDDEAWSTEVADTLTVNSGGGPPPPPPPPPDTDIELLKTYAPVLFMHPQEDYLPRDIESMLNESNLMEYVSPDRCLREPQPVDDILPDLNIGVF